MAKVAHSYCDRSIRWPLPVRRRSSRAARMAATPDRRRERIGDRRDEQQGVRVAPIARGVGDPGLTLQTPAPRAVVREYGPCCPNPEAEIMMTEGLTELEQLPTQPQVRQDARGEVLDDNVGPSDQIEEHLLARGIGEVHSRRGISPGWR